MDVGLRVLTFKSLDELAALGGTAAIASCMASSSKSHLGFFASRSSLCKSLVFASSDFAISLSMRITHALTCD